MAQPEPAAIQRTADPQDEPDHIQQNSQTYVLCTGLAHALLQAYQAACGAEADAWTWPVIRHQ